MFKVGLENNTEGRSQVWILGHPGCFAYGADGPHALEAVPQAIQDYRQWISSHTSDSWLPGSDIDYELVESWDCYSIDDNFELVHDGYEVNAWFRDDWLPLKEDDISRGLLLLNWGRKELMDVVCGLDTETFERTYPGEKWSISGILKHIAGGELWYLDRFGLAFPEGEIPEHPFESLDKVRRQLLQVLPGLAGSTQVFGVSGEFWSPRKLLRRAVWHEYDHIAHIRKLL